MSTTDGDPEPPSRSVDQERVNDLFGSESHYWRDVYEQENMEGDVYRLRRRTALKWIDELGLPMDAPVLEVGCGAGTMTAHLAERFRVTALDASADMIQLARQRLVPYGSRVTVRVGDAHDLELSDAQFGLVIGLGVIPWLHSPIVAIREMARVTRRDGWVLLTSDSRDRLTHAIDPWLSPALRPARRWLARRRGRTWTEDSEGVAERLYAPRHVEEMLRANGLEPVRSTTLGFGPFSWRGRPVFSDRWARPVNRWLQALSDRRVPGIRGRGSHHVVLARVR